MPDFLTAIFGEQQPKPGQGAVRFTPDELREWMNSDDPPTTEDLAKLHPADLRVFYGLEENATKGQLGSLGALAAVPPAISGIKSALGAPGLAQKALQLGKEALPYVAPAAGTALGAKFGSPTAGYWLGALVGGKAGPRRPSGPPPMVEEPLPPTTPASMTGTRASAPAPRMNGFSLPEQTTTTATPNAARPPKLGAATAQGEAANVIKRPPTGISGLNPEEAAEQVTRGVQHDFRGRVTFERPTGRRSPTRRPEFPPGATSKTPPDIYRQLEEAYAESQGNPAEVEAIRQFIKKALDGGR